MTKSSVDSARVAELELENDELKSQNEELKQRLAQREHDTAEIVDALNAAEKNGGGGLWQTKTYLLIFWAVVGVRLLLTSYCPWLLSGFLSLIAEVLVIGPATVCLWRWGSGEVRKDLGSGLIKSVVMLGGLFVTAMIFSDGQVVHGYMAHVFTVGPLTIPVNEPQAFGYRPMWAFLWLSLVMLLMLSPFCEWIRQNMARNPKEWFQPGMDREEAYDGFREN